MSNNYIQDITADGYEDNSYIYIPYINKTIKYSVLVQVEVGFTLDSFSVFFLDSRNGFKYKLKNIDYEVIDTDHILFNFIVDQQSSEKGNIDFLELIVYKTNSVVSFKKEIKIKYLKTSDKSLTYSIGNIKLLDSNLLSLRNKIMAPSWSTVNKNTLSNSTKLLDQLHSTFSSSYSKSNEYTRISYDYTYEPLVFERLFLTQKPKAIIREVANNKEELKETSDIYSSLYALDLKPVTFNKKISTVILEPYSDIVDELYEINSLLPTFLYFKKNKNSESRFVTCVITGFDEYDNEIVESLLVRFDIFTRTQNRFHKITNINYSDTTVEITNCVDLRYNHYVINNNFIIPAIVDENYRTYKPLVKIRSNNELTHNIITLANPLSETVDSFSKYNIDTKNNPLTSLYVTENLDVIYTYSFENNTILNYSKLNIDFTKNLYNNISMNNNKYINVSDTETLIGDWVDVKVNIEEWVQDKEDLCLLVQVRNKDVLYYYDAENNTLSTNKVLIYPQTLNKDVLDFSIQIENDQPYIFTLYNSSLKDKVTACTITHSIIPYKTEILDNQSLVLFDNKLHLVNNLDTSSISFNKQENYLYVILHSKDYSTLSYLLDFGSYFLSDKSTNINNNYFEYITKDNDYGMPVVIKIDTSFLENNTVKIGSVIDINNGLSPEQPQVLLKLIRNTDEVELVLNPKQSSEDIVKTEYNINIETLQWSINNDY